MSQIIRVKNDEGTILASSEKAKYPIYKADGHWYFHPEQVNMAYLKKTTRTWNCPNKGPAYWYDLETTDIQSQNIAWAYPQASGAFSHLAGYIGFWGMETQVSVVEEA